MDDFKSMPLFTEKLNQIFELLDASNSDFERITQYNKSALSRYRSGKRVPTLNSKSLIHLSDCIYTYADNCNMLSPIVKLCDSTSTGREEIISSLNSWLFAGAVALETTDFFTQAKKEALAFRFFGEKLSVIMNLLNLSNVRLGKILNLDPSNISRFRNGVRIPKHKGEIELLLSNTLFKRTIEKDKLSNLATLMNKPIELMKDNYDDALIVFSSWLFDASNDNDKNAIDSFLMALDSFALPENKNIVPIHMLLDDTILKEENSRYIGIDGLQRAVLRFLGNSATAKNEMLQLYSEYSMDWMTSDKEYYAKWIQLMAHTLKNGVKIKIIHNINRDISEMFSAIESWLPLYMSGLIEGYYIKKTNDPNFSHTLFVSNAHAITSYCVSGKEKNALHHYFSEAADVKRNSDEFGKLLNTSAQLLNVYTASENDKLTRHFNKLLSAPGSVNTLLHSPSIGSMPEVLLEKIIGRNNISGAQRDNIITFHKTIRNILLDALKKDGINEMLPLASDEELFSGKVRIGFNRLFLVNDYFYTESEYAEHINAMLELLNTYTNYRFYPLPENPFDNTQLYMRGSSVIAIKSEVPFAAVTFDNPFLGNAFFEYFDTLKEMYRQDRNLIREQLMRFL